MSQSGHVLGFLTARRWHTIAFGICAVAVLAGAIYFANGGGGDEAVRKLVLARLDNVEEHKRALQQLRRTDPQAYLKIVRAEQGDDAWLTELAELDPAQYAEEQAALDRKRQASQLAERNSNTCTVTMAEFASLQTGDTYDSVANKLGCNGMQLSQASMGGAHAEVYQWSGGFFGNMNAEFENNRLIAKAQFGLH